jgi:plasmid stabilization system protein ParE
MYQLEWSRRALADLDRLDAFLFAKNPRAAGAAIDTILAAADELRDFPLIGRALSDDEPEYRELPIAFSNSGYLLLYRWRNDIVEIQAVKHMREDQY